jgi:superfamily II DNA or RNA helicase
MLISRRAVNAFMSRKLDDFTWMKRLVREDIERELRSLKVRPVFKTESWLHQLVCFYIGLCQPRFLYLLDMGTGKSKIIADLITQYQRERRLEGALVTVPRAINMDSWHDDLLRHSELEPWLVNVSDTEEKWERLAHPRGDVTIIDYQGLHLAVCKRELLTGKAAKTKKYRLVRDDKKMRHLQRQYNFIGIDESHKLSNHDNLWFGIMNQLTKTAEFCYGATGTLFGKEVEDLWSQFYLVDRGETFGENLGLFRASFFTTKVNPWKGVRYVYNQRMDRDLHKMLQHRSLRYDEDEVLDLPARVQRTQLFEMGAEQQEHYLRALEGLINAEGQLTELDASWLRMRQIVSGYLAWKDENGDHILPFKENPKLDGLERLIDEMGDSKIVICYEYTESGRLITERIKSMGIDHEWYYGGTKDKTACRRRFLEDPKCRVFVMNSEAGGTGNDGLQKVARYMVFFESPCSPTSRQQTIKRIHRSGMTQRCFIYDLVMRKSLDKGILDALAEGTNIYDKVVNGRINKNILLGG